MRAREFTNEHKKNRKAIKYNKKPQKPRNFVAKNAVQSGAGAHTDKKKASKQGYEKHKTKDTVHEASHQSLSPETVRHLLAAFKETSQGVELYRDEEGAHRIYTELKNVAKAHGELPALEGLLRSASHSAHMDFDTNPGPFKNWWNYAGEFLEGLADRMRELGIYDDEPDYDPEQDVEEDIQSAQHAPTKYEKYLYVENTPEGVILYGENIESGYVDREGDPIDGYYMSFVYNLTTNKIIDYNAPEDDMGRAYPDEEFIKDAIEDIAGDFKVEYGDTWEEIDDELNGGMEVDVDEGQKFPMAGKYKQGPAGQWRNKGPSANRPAKRGDLVGGSM